MKCQVHVSKSERDHDAHGSFTRSWTEPCGAAVFREGRCAAHDRDRLRELECMAAHYEERAAGMRRELARLQEPTKP